MKPFSSPLPTIFSFERRKRRRTEARVRKQKEQWSGTGNDKKRMDHDTDKRLFWRMSDSGSQAREKRGEEKMKRENEVPPKEHPL